jgi:hypothetical protein
VAKVRAQGTALEYCGYIGGDGIDIGYGIAVDAAGNAYVTGSGTSDESTFPVTVGPDLTQNDVSGLVDAFVAKIALSVLQARGTTRPGGMVDLDLVASRSVSLPFQLGTSLGTGPIPIDSRQIDLSPDGLLFVSTSGFWPGIFSGYRGVIDQNGKASATIHIPNATVLIGTRLHTAFVTLDPAAPSGIRSISNTDSFTIAK